MSTQWTPWVMSYRLPRFLLVGLGNTTINFAALNFVFYTLHQSKILSSILATSCAIIFSFLLNRSFVFRDRTRPAQTFARFTVVSVVGTLVVQTSVYALCVTFLQGHTGRAFAIVNLSNLIASLVVTFWNYYGYRSFVFTAHGGVVADEEAA